jgi:peptidyl-tRNA hydrolase, PTH1 family
VKVICGLGNPGPEYEDTRHNIGWWVVEEAQATWRFPQFKRRGAAFHSDGRLGEHDIVLVEPLTYMNRSGSVLPPFLQREDFVLTRDLLVIVDDVALELGRMRFRADGTAGGHNGLKSVEATLGTRAYARMRIGVGAPPDGVDMADWVLGPYEQEDARIMTDRLPAFVDAVAVWIEEGIEAAANRFNGASSA